MTHNILSMVFSTFHSEINGAVYANIENVKQLRKPEKPSGQFLGLIVMSH
jgi:hypothetical protein